MSPEESAVILQQNASVASGQRRINLIWELTQAFLAVTVIGATVVVWVTSALSHSSTPTPEGLVGLSGMVIGFYFSRTNHAAIGGVGHKPNEYQDYRGR